MGKLFPTLIYLNYPYGVNFTLKEVFLVTANRNYTYHFKIIPRFFPHYAENLKTYKKFWEDSIWLTLVHMFKSTSWGWLAGNMN